MRLFTIPTLVVALVAMLSIVSFAGTKNVVNNDTWTTSISQPQRSTRAIWFYEQGEKALVNLDYSTAVTYFDSALRCDEFNDEFASHCHYYIGITSLLTRDFDTAEYHIKMAFRQITRDDIRLFSSLLASYASQGNAGQVSVYLSYLIEAINHSVIDDDTREAHIRFNRGMCLLSQDEFEVALEEFKRVPSDSELTYDADIFSRVCENKLQAQSADSSEN